MTGVRWKHEPEEHDYPAAAAYLSLIASPGAVNDTLARLRASEIVHYKAKDILRAAGLDLLPQENAHVAKDLTKIIQGKELSPILLLRGDLHTGAPLQIADGYHRVCASYHVDENTDIPCHIAGRS